ncbi:conserved hypothetical protein [Rubrivivax sp. A210]|uniref:hypothetical protein n=1 Tax=Rubrivivax sp. A210 TaxID=2772301 RepID=UPI001918A54D|nr:hypothetical protein [Rubrivivax sp. A210]CAD5366420.1 conserved hypothetical protein [Rubrivivax sp. A210]
MLTVEFKPDGADKRLAGPRESLTEANFAAQGRPQREPHKAATIRARMKRKRGSTMLIRQGGDAKAKSLAVLAKALHKRVRESWHRVEDHKIEIRARPCLPISGRPPSSATLQPGATRSVLDVFQRFPMRSAG